VGGAEADVEAGAVAPALDGSCLSVIAPYSRTPAPLHTTDRRSVG
jgi:hypothetical protein